MFILKLKNVFMLLLVGAILVTTGAALGSPAPAQPAAVDLTLGETGVSFAYAATYGQTGEPYPASVDYVYGPNGMAFDKTGYNLYVVEQESGQRLLKYDIDLFGSRIAGHPGVRGYSTDYLYNPADVQVSPTGEIWVVMDSAVKAFNESGTMLQLFPNEYPPLPGDDNQHFNDPQGIAFDYVGRLYVADTNNHRVQVYSKSSSTLDYYETITGTVGTGDAFSYPVQIAFYRNNPVFLVTDSGNHRVQICSHLETGWVCSKYVDQVAGVNLDTPTGITTQGDTAFIVDSGNRRLLKCPITDPSTCSVFAGVGAALSADLFVLPMDVAVDTDGYVFVSDRANHAIYTFNSSGVPLPQNTIGTPGVPYASTEPYFYYPTGAMVDAAGSLYVLENDGRRLVKVDPNGEIAWQYGTAGIYAQPGDRDLLGTAEGGPQGKPAVASSGVVYLSDTPRHRVVALNPDGTYLAQLGISDEAGADESHLDTPAGVALKPLIGDVYVLDAGNDRIQVFSSDRLYKATLAMADLCGDELATCLLRDLAFDRDGNLFLADEGNYRVLKCTTAEPVGCVPFAGTTGVPGTDFDHLTPTGIMVDGTGRVYVADDGVYPRLQVFSPTGAYLTTVGGGTNSIHSGFGKLVGAVVGADGALYAVDQYGFRVQKFTPGYRGWEQSNINGFGSPAQTVISTLEPFGDYLYAGTWFGPSQVWRTADGKTWSQVTPSWMVTGLGGAAVFGDYLYFGAYATDGLTGAWGEIWRTDGSDWERVVENGFADPGTTASVTWINDLEVFNGNLYAITVNADTSMQLWYSETGDAGTWTQTGGDYLDALQIGSQKVLFAAQDALYLGRSKSGLAELWRSTDGDVWAKVSYLDAVNPLNDSVSALAEYDGKLYVGFRNEIEGGEVWASEDGVSFSRVLAGGLGNPNNHRPYSLLEHNRALYLSFSNDIEGAEVWKSMDGVHWEKIVSHGWGDWNNSYVSFFDKASAVFRDTLYLGTINNANGGEVWRMLHSLSLPLIMR